MAMPQGLFSLHLIHAGLLQGIQRPLYRPSWVCVEQVQLHRSRQELGKLSGILMQVVAKSSRPTSGRHSPGSRLIHSEKLADLEPGRWAPGTDLTHLLS